MLVEPPQYPRRASAGAPTLTRSSRGGAERRLTILDEKVHAALLTHAREELMLKIHREVDSQLAMYRRKMKAEQLALVEKKYIQKRLLEEFGLPRLSLYYFS